MKRFLLALSTLLFSTSLFADFPPITLDGTELHPLESKINGRPYQLLVSYPASYQDRGEKRYPVLYALDGYWDTKLFNSMYGNLYFDQTVPEFIIVGIGYSDPSLDPHKERRKDMVPAAIQPDSANENVNGESFLRIIKEEFIPYIDQNLRTDTSYRVLSGSSLGGFFVINAMLADPEFFEAHIAISPATGLNRSLFATESQYRWKGSNERNHTRLPTRLFMSGAEKEWTHFIGNILAFDQILKHGEYEDFEYKFHLFEDEGHASTKVAGYPMALRYAFKPYLDEVKKGE